ncbi:TrmH family RNA methyltransferase [Scopulibacillus darangshiensis]|uniref:TrmH family RNA methyltransferase n=1 Tax=Scopulibacillus darangshiensis TaxID=442528 RepID=A0A4R2PDF2_9BACL|nr:RNA methyltransferase [Scopulibacillus darangshiensis]TCP32121.1 TrmH family RNA methyltransferase [Scopulibacillus darangshiensis]
MKRIESPQNQHFKHWKKLHNRKWREKTGEYLLEGPHLIQEAMKKPDIVISLIYDEGFRQRENWMKNNADEFIVDTKLFKELAQTETPQGILAVCRVMDEQLIVKQGRFLLIDSVQDPGNLGTIIRTADACGMDGVYLGAGCVDLYNQKVLRSAQGSHFHLPIIKSDLTEVVNDLKQAGATVYGSSLQGTTLQNVAHSCENFALIIGNEGNGVDEELLSLTDVNVKIPIYGLAESMNVAVASGILMYSLRTAPLA